MEPPPASYTATDINIIKIPLNNKEFVAEYYNYLVRIDYS